jgi:hypothetical protein
MSNIFGVRWRQRRGWHSKHERLFPDALSWWWPDPTLITSSSPWLLDRLQADSNPRLRPRSASCTDLPFFKCVVSRSGLADSSVSDDTSSSRRFDGQRMARHPRRILLLLADKDEPAGAGGSPFCLASVCVPLSENVLPPT